uniref:Venom protein family 6 protein 3 n=1 Tax=Platymeris rhadamanthus TaxID=1134088 RepID=A0A6B9L3I9_PLARH|nr:venom protein family 6 protein 3 [Platymeris rhadamanthus]
MLKYIVFLTVICCYSAFADVSAKEKQSVKDELLALENQLKHIYKSTLENIDKDVSIRTEEARKRSGNKGVECAAKLGHDLIVEAEEKAREACVGFIESCRNLREMIEKDAMNQMELNQTRKMLRDDGLFKQQVNRTVTAVNEYISKKTLQFQSQVKQC